MQKVRAKFLTALLLMAITLAIFPLSVKASTGNILINTATAPSTVGQTVAAGGNVSLYFGGVTWSGSQFYLVMSTDGFSQISTSDTRYSALFNINNLTAATVSQYTYTGGYAFSIGSNWVNGTIHKNLAGGNYYIKAYDGSSTSVAVTDTYITLTAALYVSPNSGCAGTPLTLSGYAFLPNALVNLSYLNPITGPPYVSIATLISANASGIFTYDLTAPDLKQALAAGLQAIANNTISFRATANATGTNYDTAIGFDEFKRGLKQAKVTGAGSTEALATAGNLYGNLTDFSATLTNLGVAKSLMLAGDKGFYPGNASLTWDNAVALGTTTVNGTGWFNTTVTIPSAFNGLHNITILDANSQKFIIFVTVVPSLVLNPTSGPVGTSVTANGYGFPAPSGTTVVNATLSWPGVTPYIASAFVDATGSFTVTFVVPTSAGGANTVTGFANATGSFISYATATFTVTASFIVTPSSFANNGSLLVVASGLGFNPVNYYSVNLDNAYLAFDAISMLDYPSVIRCNSSGYLSLSFVGTGFRPGQHVVSLYANDTSVPEAWATFTVTDAGDPIADLIKSLNGTLLSINGTMATIITAQGTITTSLASINAAVTDISGNVVTISTSLGTLQTSVDAIDAKLTSISNGMATISTSVGTITTSLGSIGTTVTSISGDVATIKTDVATIKGTVTSTDGKVATIQTDIGTLKADISGVSTDVGDISGISVPIWIAVVLALIAAIAAIVCVIQLRRKIAG